jgi:hypothetical protein
MTMIALAVIDPIPLCALAETKTIEAEATYIMGDGESPAFAESMALQKAKQTALEQAGTYVESYTKIQNLDLTTEEIQIIAGGVLEVEVLEKNRVLVADALRFYVKINATVTTDKMVELANRIKGKNIAQEYDRLLKDHARLNKELESLKAIVAKTSQGPERESALARTLEQERALTELQRSEKVFFKRLLAGETLVRQARDERTTVDQLMQTIRDQGHIVEIGKPVTSVKSQALLEVELPITVSSPKGLLESIRGVVISLEGMLYPVPERGGILTPKGWLSKPAPRITYLVPHAMNEQLEFRGAHQFSQKYGEKGDMFRPSLTDEAGRVYKRQLRGTMIRLSFSDGSEQTCRAPFVVTRLIPVDEYFGTLSSMVNLLELEWETDWFVSSPYHEGTQRKIVQEIAIQSLRDYANYVGWLSDPISFRARFRLSEQKINALKGFEAKFVEVKSRESLAKDLCLTVIDNN